MLFASRLSFSRAFSALSLCALPIVLHAQVPQKPARTVPDGETLPPGPPLRISLASTIEVAGRAFSPAAPPRGFTTNAELGLMHHESMTARLLHHQEGVRADAVRVTRTPGGDLLAVIGCGIGHYAPRGGAHLEKRNDLLIYRSQDNGRTWRGPSILFPVAYSMHGFIPLIPQGTKRLYCFGTEPIPGEREDRENAPIAFRHSDDDGHTWSAPTIIRPVNDPAFKGMSCMQMTETDRGTWILGSHEAHWDPGSETYETWVHRREGMLHTRQYLLRSEDRGATWTVIPDGRPKGWFAPGFDRMDEARPLALGNGKVLTLIRTAAGQLWSTRSEDDGKTWSNPAPTDIVHPDAPPMLFKLSDQRTLIVLHHNVYDPKVPHAPNETRNQLWYKLSKDEGRTWSESRLMMSTAGESRSAQISYVDLLVERGEIQLFVTYAWKQTLQVTFKERDLAHMPTAAEFGRLVKP